MKRCLTVLLILFLLCSCGGRQDASNSIIVIAPYRYAGTWVFDDPRVGLVREPFVSGIPELIDKLVKDIPDADKGFRLLFSGALFRYFKQAPKVIYVKAEPK